jgi:two-component system, LytTR family, sensor kinase
MPLSSVAKRRWLLAIAFFGIFTALALLTSLAVYASSGAEQPVPWGPLLRQEFKNWYACGLLALGVLWFCGKNRLEPGKVMRWVMIHFAAACVFSMIYVVVTSWWVAGERSVMNPGQILTFSYLFKKMALHYFVMNLILYWMVVFGHFAWLYYQRFREHEMHTAQLQRELVQARLDALRMQLNPHFLFNTLHAISALIHDQPEAADRMVARLSELLRLSLDPAKPQEVPLNEELAFLEGYLEIEQTRFPERLRITRQIQADTRAALVPFLLLQPLVENAIRHGIEPREQSGRLEITACRHDGKLELRVTDDGPGLSQTSTEPAREGIGLSNTRSRLRHLYGEDFSLELKDLPQGGLEARIVLPFRTHAEPN